MNDIGHVRPLKSEMKQTYAGMTEIRLAVCLLLSLSLTGCGSGQTQPQQKAQDQDQTDMQGAEMKLAAMMKAKEQSAQQAEAARHKQEEQEARQQVADYLSQFSPVEVAAAARPRKWGSITVPDLNVKCVFNSTWTEGNLNYRIALLGQRAAITTFLADFRRYHVNFEDQQGNIIFAYDLNPADFQWESDSYNGGIPTMDTRGAVPMDLKLYENSMQWNLTYDS